jgi:hypothetical protein
MQTTNTTTTAAAVKLERNERIDIAGFVGMMLAANAGVALVLAQYVG